MIGAWLYVAALAATLTDQFVGLPAVGDAAGVAILAFPRRECPRQRRYAQVRFVTTACIGLAGSGWYPIPAPARSLDHEHIARTEFRAVRAGQHIP